MDFIVERAQSKNRYSVSRSSSPNDNDREHASVPNERHCRARGEAGAAWPIERSASRTLSTAKWRIAENASPTAACADTHGLLLTPDRRTPGELVRLIRDRAQRLSSGSARQRRASREP